MKGVFLFISLAMAATTVMGQTAQKNCGPDPSSNGLGKWRWLDGNFQLRSRADLAAILARHSMWLTKYYTRSPGYGALEKIRRGSLAPLRADLSGAWLRRVDFRSAYLFRADLTGANLEQANLSCALFSQTHLTHANLSRAALLGTQIARSDLSGANLNEADLSGANLHLSDLSGVSLIGANLSGAHLWHTKLVGAFMLSSKLSDAQLCSADLSGADLSDANLIGADLSGADMSNTILENADLSGAEMPGARLWNADFEPKRIPAASGIARAEGLRTLRWNKLPKALPAIPRWNRIRYWFGNRFQVGNRIPMRDLRKELHDAGYLDAEREVNLAYHRMEQRWWEEILFDWSCEWGANWRRPLRIVGALWAVCSVLYWLLLRFDHRNRLFVIGVKGKREQRLRVQLRTPVPSWFQGQKAWWRPQSLLGAPWRRIRWEMRLYWTVALFSLMSVLNLGLQGLDLGRWVRLMHRRDFDLAARGVIRTIAGMQSILSFALLALAALSYLGHSFE